MSRNQVTFQETFGQYPFPEGVLACFAQYPTQVKVCRQTRTMTVELEGGAAEQGLVDQVRQSLARLFSLNQVAVEFHTQEVPAGTLTVPSASEAVPPVSTQAKPAPSGDLFAQMEAMRRKVLNQSNPGGGHGKPKVKQIYGKIIAKW